jgi:DNA-binding transcriptional ArsR family regulator
MEPGAKEQEAGASTSRRAQVLKHPLRARIAGELEKRSMDPPELAEALGEPAPVVAYHCDVLTEAGLA